MIDIVLAAFLLFIYFKLAFGCESMGTCKCYVFASNYWLTAEVPPVLPVLPPVSVFGEAIDAL